MKFFHFLIISCLFLAYASPARAQFKPRKLLENPVSVTVNIHQISKTPDQAAPPGATIDATGRPYLKFLGGLVFQSDHPQFGGFSGLHMTSDGSGFFAVSDAGLTVSGRLKYDGTGRLTHADEFLLAPIFVVSDPDSAARRHRDAEAIAFSGDHVTVVFEQESTLSEFRHDGTRLVQHLRDVELPGVIQRFHGNSGFESLAIFPDRSSDRLILISSRRDSSGHFPIWIFGGSPPVQLYLKSLDSLRPTDLTVLPDGTILILERDWSIGTGFRSRIRAVQPDPLTRARVLSGKILWSAESSFGGDNLEGIAWYQRQLNGQDRMIISVISDDNFNPFQTTQLLQFSLDSDALNRDEITAQDFQYIPLPTRRRRIFPTRRPGQFTPASAH